MASDADEGGELSGDEGFDEDMEALSRACFLTGTDPRSLRHPSSSSAVGESEDEDDFELVRGIRQRFNACCSEAGEEAPLTLKPLNVLLPSTEEDEDDDEDDFAILRRIQKRFSCYDQDADGLKNNREKQEQVRSKSTFPEKGTFNSVELDSKNAPKAVPDFPDMHNTSDTPETLDAAAPDTFPSCLTEVQETDTHDLAMVPTEGCGFPKAAQMFVEAIRKNRACQKFIRNKMMQTEARIEENKKLQHRVKILRGFQIKCKKQTTRALSRQQDARVQLISAAKPKGKSKANGKKDSTLCHGPAENSQVACYKMVLAEYRMSLSRRKWTDEERENLSKGIKQQFQELLLQRSVDSISEMVGDSDDVDSIYASIRDRDITSEEMRLFLPKVNWERLVSMYVKGRSAAECEARWLNWEDPLINHKPWTNSEDKKLLHIVQQRGISNWIEIAVLLETNRTPFQCLARYQRSLNASVMRSEWSKDEDEKLRAAVAAFGESNWENVAATLVGRTGPQCSNRWIKSLNPAREKTGKWSSDEDKRVKVAVVFFGPKNWKKVAQFVPGRTHVQCRERWANNLNPSLNLGEWTEEEDIKLKAAIVEHGYCWSKVAACVTSRTDNQCTRRWKALFPHEVPLLQAARKIQKAALISNFVDRESERPALGPKDFIPLQLTNAVSESGELNQSGKRRTKPRSKKATKKAQICTDEIISTNTEKIAGEKTNSNKKPIQRRRKNKEVSEATNVEKVAGEKTNSKKKLIRRRHENKESSEATEDARVGQEIVPFDGEMEKKKTTRKRKIASRSKKATKAAQICTDEILLTNSADIENIDGEKRNSKNQPTRRQRKKNKEASAAIEDGRVGEEIRETEKKRTPRKRKMALREGPKEKDGAATSRVDALADVGQATEPQRKKIRSCLTNSRLSICGDSEVLTMNNLEEAGECIGDGVRAKNKRSSELGREKNEQCKRFDEAASSFGENEAFSEGGRFSSPHLEHDWHADPNEVNSSPCPNSTPSRIANVHEAGTFAHDSKRRKDSVKSRSRRIKRCALLREVSDITEISDSETLGSIVLKEREMRRSLKKQSGLIHSSQKSGSMINKKVNAVDEGEFLEISRAGENIQCSAHNHSRLRGKRKGCIPRARKIENAELGNKLSRVDNGTHQGKSRKKSSINEQLGMTLASFIKKGQKKRRLNLAPKTPPLDEFSYDARVGWL